MAATTTTLESQQRVRLITGWHKKEKLPLLPDYPSMKLLFWNCRGAGNINFKNTMADLHRDQSPDVIMLFETKVLFQSTKMYFDQLGFSESIIMDPVGRVGGIWVLWNPTSVNLKGYHADSQVVHAIVTKNNFE